MKTTAIMQARTGSERLPGKVMLKLCDKSVLEHDIERLKLSKEIDEIIVATTTSDKDDIIEEEALKCSVKCFRGSEDDVLARYYYAAKEAEGDIIVRITSDCPLIDPKITDKAIRFYKENEYPYVTISGFPRGLDTEVFSFEFLEEAFNNAFETWQREHVTPYMYEEGKTVGRLCSEKDCSKYRWTLDTKEDYMLISKIYGYLYKDRHNFYLEDIIQLMEKHPELYDINKDIQQKTLKE